MESLKKRLKPEKECDKIKVGHRIGLFAFSFVPPNLDRACPTRKYRAFYMPDGEVHPNDQGREVAPPIRP